MYSELFRIPLDWLNAPVMGGVSVGLLLALAIGVGIVKLLAWGRRTKRAAEAWGYVPGLVILAAALLWVPRWVTAIPVRGYGVMVLLGSLTGLLMATHRARQINLSAEVIPSLAFGMFLCGFLGARLFFVIEYWETRFQSDDWQQTLWEAVKFTEGGLVIYGAFFGATLAFFVFTLRHRLSPLAMADLIAPSLLAGLAFGRIGCLLHGCCYGGESALPWAVTFPRGSMPYLEQLAAGQMLGMRSLPVHPTQIYSAVQAALLAWVLWSFYPFRRRDGQVTALMLTIYPLSRFLLEFIRIDESAFFDTGLSISQNISLVLFVLALGLWIFLSRQPPQHISVPQKEE